MSQEIEKQATEAAPVKVKAEPAARFAPADGIEKTPVAGDTLIIEAPKTLQLKLAEPFERDDYDGEIDVNKLPALPWTRDNLGEAQFKALAAVAGVGDLQDHQRNPSLDPRSFGRSRAFYLIRKYGLKGEQAQAYLEEGEALQEAIDANLDPVKGTPRNPKAKPLKPARTKHQSSGPGPKMWTS